MEEEDTLIEEEARVRDLITLEVEVHLPCPPVQKEVHVAITIMVGEVHHSMAEGVEEEEGGECHRRVLGTWVDMVVVEVA